MLEKGELNQVYRPNDDTFFMLDVLFQESRTVGETEAVLEIGCGSGYLITHFLYWLKERGARLPCQAIATDINIDACFLTKKFAAANGIYIDVINANITNGLSQHALKDKVDIIICNPPYVPTE